jgi:hypothetical protein
MDFEQHHRVAVARELTYAAGVPLRDRFGFAADDQDVLTIVEIVFGNPSDENAANALGYANALGTIQIAEGYDEPTGEDYERRIVAALRPLVEDRRQAAGRALR